MDKRDTRVVISGILAFILTIVLFFLALLACTAATVFDKSYVENKLLNSGYYKEALNEVIDNFETLGIPGGIPRQVFVEAIDEVRIYNDFIQILDASFDGKTHAIDTKIVDTSLKNAFVEYAMSQNGGLTDEEDENLDGLVKYCSDSYRQIIDNKIITYLGQIKISVSKLLIPAFIGIAAVVVFLITFIYKLHYYRHRAFRYMSYSFIASFIMTAAMSIYMLSDKMYTKLQITPEYVYNFLVEMIEGFLIYLLWSGVIMGAIAACLIIAIIIKKGKYRKESASQGW